MVFAAPFGLFYHDKTNPAHLSGLSHLDNFAWKRKLLSTYLDFAKTHANPDPPAGGTATPHTTGPLYVRFSNTDK
jgi:hypothetical protein